MKIRRGLPAVAFGAALMIPAALVYSQETTIANAIVSGETNMELRYRYEFVDQDSFDDNAQASTLRLRLNYATDNWNAWSGFVEFDHVFEVVANNYNSGSGTSNAGRDDYPVVADPDGPDLNQAYLQYLGGDELRGRVGRQRILLDDQRFVGGVGWRQNEQTYDGVSVRYADLELFDIFYSYISNVNRIFGREVSSGDHRQNTHLLNAAVPLNDAWKATGYAYILDNEDAPAFSTRTFGMRVSGNLSAGEGKIALLGEFASQSDNANNPASFDVDYFRVQADWTAEAISIGAGIESLGSESGESFRTPLATLHSFNGWADQFLSTPASGLEDLYLRFGYKPGEWNLQCVYHVLSAKSGSSDYGNELDVSAGRNLGKRYGLLVKLAVFNADAAPFVDTTKFWLMLTAQY